MNGGYPNKTVYCYLWFLIDFISKYHFSWVFSIRNTHYVSNNKDNLKPKNYATHISQLNYIHVSALLHNSSIKYCTLGLGSVFSWKFGFKFRFSLKRPISDKKLETTKLSKNLLKKQVMFIKKNNFIRAPGWIFPQIWS